MSKTRKSPFMDIEAQPTLDCPNKKNGKEYIFDKTLLPIIHKIKWLLKVFIEQIKTPIFISYLYIFLIKSKNIT